MILTGNKEKCCGCSACTQICPSGAIVMYKDELGFLYPEINGLLCVHCDLCSRVCPFQSSPVFISRKETWAAYATDIDRKESSSGGIFASIAQAFIADGGAVCGSSMYLDDGKLHIMHKIIYDQKDLPTLKGSKYVQSTIGNTYKEVRDTLHNGTKVLFSGTPCQVAGLKGFLGKEYSGLFCIDIVCHGVPSEQLFQDYISHYEKNQRFHINRFIFRDKTEGWKLHGRIEGINHKGEKEIRFIEPEQSSYYQMFLNGYLYRENCYVCPFASDTRSGDVTLGDYWCIDLVHPEYMVYAGGTIDDREGVSSLIINNEKGEQLLNQYGGGISRWKSSYDKASKYNAQLRVPSRKKKERAIVVALYQTGDYGKVESWYQRRLRMHRLKRKMKAMVPRIVKDNLKRAMKRVQK